MSVIGKGSSSFKKQDVMEQKGIALGFKKIRFAHKATAGDASINLTTLVTPTEMSSLGFTNPSPTTLVNAQLGIYRNNLKLVSSLRGLLVDQLSYVASSTAITFVGFTAEDGEIFQGWLDEAPTTSLQVVDGTTIVASGILAAGQTDFNIGTPITINKNPAQTIGAVMVFADRGLQYRKVGNVVTGDGDYIEVPVSGGLGSLLRFNASASDRFITVMSNGVVAERPDGSMMAAIERVQGQVDAMVPTLAQVAGVPETTFQTAPNDVNLKQFGDQVVTNTTTIADHETRIITVETRTVTQVARYQTAAGQSLADNIVDGPINFGTPSYDPQNSVLQPTTNWRFVAQSAGVYRITGLIKVVYPTNAGVRGATYIRRYSALGVLINEYIGDDRNQVTSTGYGGAVGVKLDGSHYLNAGEYIQIYALQGSGAPRTLSPDGAANWIAIEKTLSL